MGLGKLDRGLEAIAETAAVCNEARIEAKGGVYKAMGAPTEAALLVLAEKLGVPDAAAQQAIMRERQADPEANPCGVCDYYDDKWGR